MRINTIMESYIVRCLLLAVVTVTCADAACTINFPDGIKTVTDKWDNCVAMGDASFFWKYDIDKTTFTCAMVVPRADGFVGVGFRKEEDHSMWGADIYAGFIDAAGKTQFGDYLSKQPSGSTAKGKAPTKDGTQNGKLLKIAHSGKNSVLEFSRPIKAQEGDDVTIDLDEEMDILWATGPDTGDKLNYHGTTTRGIKRMELENGASSIQSLSICGLTILFSWIFNNV